MKPTRIRVKFIELQGDIIALFPDYKEGNGFIMSYQHMGQHSSASDKLMHCETIKDDRITDLLQELKSIEYIPVFHDAK